MPENLNCEGKLERLRKQACDTNMASQISGEVLKMVICPTCKEPVKRTSDSLECKSGHRIPIENGFPNFVVFSQNAMEEKEQQASFHDDEEHNELFSEVVLRPYNYNKVHADSWLYHLKYFKNLLSSKFGLELENISILNCGCGGGFEAEFFAIHGAKVTGFDISQLRIEAAATRLRRKNLNGFFYRGDASILPFPENSFDVVIYHDSLHHVPIEEIPIAVREAARVAKKGIVLLEAHDSPLRMLLEIMGLSSSIEGAGNYVFRFRKSLMEFWASQYSLNLVNYSVLFTKKEHRPRLYSKPILGWLAYKIIRLFGTFLKPVGNEACIIFKKAEMPHKIN